jgi:murein L,D-transpeptidase YcbB/YkuD
LSQHYAGLSFDVGQNLTNNARSVMRNLAISSGIWNYVEPASDTPTWVHFDERQVASGYPLLRRGSKGVYVCVLQDALTTLGYNTGGLDGIFGSNTYNSVLNFQKTRGLIVDGLVGNNTWRTLMAEVVGKGASSTTVN